MIRKITDGYVIQTYTDDGKPVSQEFTAGDICEWEQDNGEFGDCIDCPEEGDKFPYIPFQMVQPDVETVVTEAKAESK